MSSSFKAHIALWVASLIYGFNYSIAKDVMPVYLQPLGFIVLRAAGALILFWLSGLFVQKEKIRKKDMIMLAIAALFGVAINQMMFFAGLNITTPINAAIIMTSNPIVVLLFAGFVIRERITLTKTAGIAFGITGAISLLLLRGDLHFGSETMLGDFYILINSLSFAIYIVMIKPYFQKYHFVTIMKWVFLFGFFYVLPFGVSDLPDVKWNELPSVIWLEITFVVVATTFLAYLLNMYSLKHLSPSVVSSYIYLQPVLATFIALYLGKDQLTVIKVISTILIFAGVYLVSRPKITIK